MSYTIDRLIENTAIDDVDARTRAALAAQGFGVSRNSVVNLDRIASHLCNKPRFG